MKNRLVFLIVIFVLTACAPTPTPTPSLTPTLTPTATNTPMPTNTLTPSPMPTPSLPEWEGSAWKIGELKNRNVEVKGNTVVFKDIVETRGDTYQYKIKNTDGLENIRKLEHGYEWPVVVAEKDGEAVAYCWLNETWLPMFTKYSELHEVGLKAVEILVKEGKLLPLEDLEKMIDPAVNQVVKTYDDSAIDIFTSKIIILNLLRGGSFQVYDKTGKMIGIDRLIFNINFSGEVEGGELLVVAGGVGGREMVGTLIGDDHIDYPLGKLEEKVPVGKYAKVNLVYEFMFLSDWTNKNTVLLNDMLNKQGIDGGILDKFIHTAIYQKRILPLDYLLRVVSYNSKE